MSIAGSSSGDAWKTSRSSWTWMSSPQSVGGPQAGETGGGSSGSPRCVRICRMGPGSVMNAISRMSPPHAGHSSGNSSPTRARSFAQAIREVSWEGGLSHESQPWPVASPRADLGHDTARGPAHRDPAHFWPLHAALQSTRHQGAARMSGASHSRVCPAWSSSPARAVWPYSARNARSPAASDSRGRDVDFTSIGKSRPPDSITKSISSPVTVRQ